MRNSENSHPTLCQRIGVRSAGRALGLAVFLALAFGEAQAQPRADARFELRISAGRLTLKADNIPLEEVLRRVAQALNARLSISGHLVARPGPWDLRQVRVAEAIAQIARPANILVVHDRDAASGDDDLVREIYVIAASEADSKQPVQASTPSAQRIREMAETLTSDADSDIRRAAAAELGGIGTDEGVRALEKALGDADSGVRVEVVESLGRIGTEEAIRLLGQTAMGSGDPDVLAAAMRVLEGSTSELARAMLLSVEARSQAAARVPRQSGSGAQQ